MGTSKQGTESTSGDIGLGGDIAVELVRLDKVEEVLVRALRLADPSAWVQFLIKHRPERAVGEAFDRVREELADLEAKAKQRHIDRVVNRIERGEQVVNAEEALDVYTRGVLKMDVLGRRDMAPREHLAVYLERKLVALNRPLNDARWRGYTDDIADGKWWTVPDPIVITDDGQVINGQHRLMAALHVEWEDDELETLPSFVVVWNVDKKAALIMDEARRTPDDRRNIVVKFANAVSA